MADARVGIRATQPEDLDAAAELYAAVAAEGIYIGAEAPVDKGARRERWEKDLSRDDSLSLVAEAGGEIVGLAGLDGVRVPDLGMLVAREWRGRGVGTRLLRACIEWARERGAHKISLQVWPHNHAALRLYRKFGFEQEGYLRKHYRRRNGELWDAVIMGLLLDEDGEVPESLNGSQPRETTIVSLTSSNCQA
jgi:RimJ/RimL family protein N-acetyltransferase